MELCPPGAERHETETIQSQFRLRRNDGVDEVPLGALNGHDTPSVLDAGRAADGTITPGDCCSSRERLRHRSSLWRGRPPGIYEPGTAARSSQRKRDKRALMLADATSRRR